MSSNRGIGYGLILLLSVGGAGACGASPTEPAPQAPLRLDGRITQPVIGPGDAATLTFTLRNVSSRIVTMGFPSSCQLMPYVMERTTQRIVYPSGGGWVCLAVITGLTLAPGESHPREVQVRAAEVTTQVPALLPPGEYEAFARLEDYTFRLRSEPVLFSVR
jgi:hypothetical protein